MKLHPFLLTAFLALGFAGPSHAQVVLFDNLLQADDGAAGFHALEDRFASDFLTDSTIWTITRITAKMGNSSGDTTHTVTFSIFSDNGSGKPGSLVSIFDTPVSVPPHSPPNSYGATTAGITLQPNTPYWLVGQVDQLSLGTVTWDFSFGEGTDSGPLSTVPSTQIQFSSNSGGNYVNSNVGNQIFRLEGTGVPEPQSWVALLVTLGTFGTLRWWTNREG